MGDILRKAKRGITKAAQKAAAGSGVEGFLDDFPPIPVLDELSQISIKVADVSEVQAAVRAFVFGKNTAFEPIRFLVRNDEAGKAAILDARVESERGFVLHKVNKPKEDLLIVSLPSQSPSIIGKLQHPSGATLYKIQTTKEPDKFAIAKTGGEHTRLELMREPKPCLQGLKAAQLLFDDHVYKIRVDGKSLVKIRPKAKSDTNTYIINFTEHCSDWGVARKANIIMEALYDMSDMLDSVAVEEASEKKKQSSFLVRKIVHPFMFACVKDM